MNPVTGSTTDTPTIVLEGSPDAGSAVPRILDAVVKRGAGSGLVRIVQPVTPIDPLEWALLHPHAPARMFWENRDEDDTSAGLGVARVSAFHAAADLPGFGEPASATIPPVRYLLTGSFDEPWPEFDGMRVTLPAWELRRTGRAHALIHQQFLAPGAAASTDPPSWLVREDPPASDTVADDLDPIDSRDDYEHWIAAVERVLEDIERRDVEKVVLARRIAFDAPVALDPFHLMRRLRDVHRSTFRYVVQMTPDCAFLGASPELLYRRRDRFIESEAVAGTRPRGTSMTNDRRLAEELLSSDKERREQQLVVEHVASRLVSLCRTFNAAPTPTVQRLANAQHLRTAFQGTLADGVHDEDILTALHPTPATCGWPIEPSRERISELEPFARGLYAGPIAWMGPDATECAVALRCGRVDGDRLTLYAGAGIVAGSDPHAEWDETETKLSAFRCVVNPRHD